MYESDQKPRFSQNWREKCDVKTKLKSCTHSPFHSELSLSRLSLSLSLPPLSRAEGVQHDTYAVAAASLELGLLYLETGNLDSARQILESTKYDLICVQTTEVVNWIITG